MTFVGPTALTGTGNILNNTIAGNSGGRSDRLEGGDSDNVLKGGEASHLLRYSEALDQDIWQHFGAPVTVNAVTAPAGAAMETG